MKQFIFLVLPLLFLMGCSSSKKSGEIDEAGPQMSNSSLSNSPWELSILNGNLIHSQMEIKPYMKITGNTVSGNAGCNRFQGNYSKEGSNGLTFGDLSGTKMACPDLAIENNFMKALKDTRSFLVKADTLILLNSDRVALAKLLSVADLEE